MQHKKENWVVGIEQELAKHPIRRIAWIIILLVSGIIFFIVTTFSDLFGQLRGYIILIFFIAMFIAFAKIMIIPRNPNYLAYYLYIIGDELSDFEIETNFLKRNRNYLENCGFQISYIVGDGTGYDIRNHNFAKGIVDFADNLDSIILRLNNIYSQNYDKDAINEKIEGMSSESSITEKEFLSSNIINLANQIHKDHSTLSPTHMGLATKILNELKDIPEKPFSKSFKMSLIERWNKLPYILKYLISGTIIFGIFFYIFSQILIYLNQEQAYSYALASSVVLTIFILSLIYQKK